MEVIGVAGRGDVLEMGGFVFDTVLVNPTARQVLAVARSAGIAVPDPPPRWWRRRRVHREAAITDERVGALTSAALDGIRSARGGRAGEGGAR